MARGVRKPAEIEAAQGYPGRRKTKTDRVIKASVEDVESAPPAIKNDDAAATSELELEPPAFLNDDAAEIWRTGVADLAIRAVIKKSEHATFARYCEYFAMWIRLRREIGKRATYTTTSAHGTMRRTKPEFKALLDVEGVLRQLEDRFGLNPSFRTALNVKLANLPDKPKPVAGKGGHAAPQKTGSRSPIGILGVNAAQQNAGRKAH